MGSAGLGGIGRTPLDKAAQGKEPLDRMALGNLRGQLWHC